jgi:anthraniloyl-CoA monooxygenase
MKVNILGGGPAGLYLAILLHQDGHQVEVWERNAKDNTFGWGVVFSDRTIAALESPDPLTHQRLTARMRTWENVDIIHRGVLTSVAGNRFSGIARIELLQLLQERCQELAIPVHYEHDISELAPLLEADLVVGADGVRSTLRTRFAEQFGTTLSEGRNHYIWYGTRQPFGGLTLAFEQHQDELYMVHSYKYSQELSTFIVEVDEPTWSKIGHLEDPRAHLEKVLAPVLGGHPLLTNQSRWIRFLNVANQNWWFGNCVLLGDALRTAHFSIGSGTKLAMEDSLALWQSLREHSTVDKALPAFEAARRPKVDRFVQAAVTSQRWFEQAREKLSLDVIPFVYECMTRSARVDDDELARRDPVFAAAYTQYRATH